MRRIQDLFQVMVLGSGSHVGKSLLAAGLCRILANRGLRVAPFKAQNMALNSAVTADGGEIGRAQALQALAARVLPRRAMNPVLLKPVRGQGSQLILLGRPQGHFSTRQYFKLWPKAAAVAQEAWAGLAEEHDALVIEGAGSPAEVNLAHRDLANLETARFSKAPWILVVDIERGGAFAATVGTLALVPAWLRKRLLGVVFNKFRGDASLLDPGKRWLKARGIPFLGVLPWLDGLQLDQEDSLGIPQGQAKSKDKKALNIEVLRLPFISNFNDAQVLEGLPGVNLRWAMAGHGLTQNPIPDLLILPGSKDSLADLATLKALGGAERLKRLKAKGTWILGLCGGFQMLGQSISDPVGNDSGRKGSSAAGLGLLDCSTRMSAKKLLALTKARAKTPWGSFDIQGYQIHHGRTTLGPKARLRSSDGAQVLLASDPSGRIWGSYLHGLLDNDAFRQAFLGAVAKSRGKRLPASTRSYESLRQAQLDRWAGHISKHLDLSFLPKGAR